VGVTLVKAAHVQEMQNALIAERTHPLRRGYSLACGANCSDATTVVFSRVPVTGDVVLADDWNDVTDYNNSIQYNIVCLLDGGLSENPYTISPSKNVGDLITKDQLDRLRSDINQIEYACICNAFCNCDINCGNNAECPEDGQPY